MVQDGNEVELSSNYQEEGLRMCMVETLNHHSYRKSLVPCLTPISCKKNIVRVCEFIHNSVTKARKLEQQS